MGKYTGVLIKTADYLLIAAAVILAMLQFSNIFFPKVGEPAATYDCDDATLDMHRHFKQLGMESTPVVGNLDMSGETYTQSNHVWLLVKAGNRMIAYDWGKPRFDQQHYEGYKISYDYLVYAVQQDEKSPDLLAIADAQD